MAKTGCDCEVIVDQNFSLTKYRPGFVAMNNLTGTAAKCVRVDGQITVKEIGTHLPIHFVIALTGKTQLMCVLIVLCDVVLRVRWERNKTRAHKRKERCAVTTINVTPAETIGFFMGADIGEFNIVVEGVTQLHRITKACVCLWVIVAAIKPDRFAIVIRCEAIRSKNIGTENGRGAFQITCVNVQEKVR